jgi:hypothetical protein
MQPVIPTFPELSEHFLRVLLGNNGNAQVGKPTDFAPVAHLG